MSWLTCCSCCHSQLINTPVLYNGIMKPMARQVLINTAEKNGVKWRSNVSEWEAMKGEVDAEFAALTNPSVTYPVRTAAFDALTREWLPRGTPSHVPPGQYLPRVASPTTYILPSTPPQEYYLMPFHAYDEGNLNWLAAFEAESATYAMALRVWPQEVKAGTCDSFEAQRRLRAGYTDALANYIKTHKLAEPKEILDIGCSARERASERAHARRTASFPFSPSPARLTPAFFRPCLRPHTDRHLHPRPVLGLPRGEGDGPGPVRVHARGCIRHGQARQGACSVTPAQS